MKVWTFVIVGGDLLPIRIHLAGSPLLDHEGSRTIWKMVGTEGQADAIQKVLETVGCSVQRYSEGQSPEQAAERRELLGLDED